MWTLVCVCVLVLRRIKNKYNSKTEDETRRSVAAAAAAAAAVVSTSVVERVRRRYAHIGGTRLLHRRRRRSRRRPSAPEFRRLTVLVRDRLWRRRRLLLLPVMEIIPIWLYLYTYITCVGPSVNFGGSRSDSLGNNIMYIYIVYSNHRGRRRRRRRLWRRRLVRYTCATHTRTSVLYIFCIYDVYGTYHDHGIRHP